VTVACRTSTPPRGRADWVGHRTGHDCARTCRARGRTLCRWPRHPAGRGRTRRPPRIRGLPGDPVQRLALVRGGDL
jgi:hypothetical protein